MPDETPVPPILRSPLHRRTVLRGAAFGALAVAATTGPWRLLGGERPAYAAGSTWSPLRPPATPLAVRSMYLSTWLPGDNLAGNWPIFWAGAVTAITGIVRIDGTAYVFAGAPGSPVLPLLSQTSLTYTATQSTYTFGGGGINLSVNFLSPVDPDSLGAPGRPRPTRSAATH